MATQYDRETLVRDRLRGVWRYLRFLGCDRSLADDLTQETFIVFLRKPFDYQGPEPTSAYLRNIARYVYLESRRQSGHNHDHLRTDLDTADSVFTEQAGSSDGDLYLEALQECEKTLAGRAQAAVYGFYRDHRTHQQIATEIDMKPNGVKTLLQRARQHLRDCIERRLR